jgi:predicted nucleic acid-binding protein
VIFFLDTSALVKRYLNEAGSGYVRRLVHTAGGIVYQSFLSPVEFASAVYRRHRAGELTAEELSLFLRAYALHSHEEYLLLPYSQAVVEAATALVARYPLRALDALQLAGALRLRDSLPPDSASLTFVCADDRLVTAALHEHLAAQNPEKVS